MWPPPRAPVSPASWNRTSPARWLAGAGGVGAPHPAPPGRWAGRCPNSHAESPQGPAHCPQGPGAGLTLRPPPCMLLGKDSLCQWSAEGGGPGRGLQSLRGRGLENTRAGRPRGCVSGCVSLQLPSRPAAVSLCEGHAAPEGVSLWKSRLPLTRRRLPREAPPSRRPQALGAAQVQLRRPELPEAPARPARGPALGRARELSRAPAASRSLLGKLPHPRLRVLPSPSQSAHQSRGLLMRTPAPAPVASGRPAAPRTALRPALRRGAQVPGAAPSGVTPPVPAYCKPRKPKRPQSAPETPVLRAGHGCH